MIFRCTSIHVSALLVNSLIASLTLKTSLKQADVIDSAIAEVASSKRYFVNTSGLLAVFGFIRGYTQYKQAEVSPIRGDAPAVSTKLEGKTSVTYRL